MKIKNSKIFISAIILFSYLPAFSVNYYPNGDGNFESTSTWLGGTTYPGSADNITYRYYPVVPASNTISLNSNPTIYDFDFSNCNTTTITLRSGDGANHTLTVNNLKIEVRSVNSFIY